MPALDMLIWCISLSCQIADVTLQLLTTGPQPLPKPVLHTVPSSAFSFNLKYPLFSLTSSDSGLRLLPRLPVTSIFPPYFPSILTVIIIIIIIMGSKRNGLSVKLTFHLHAHLRVHGTVLSPWYNWKFTFWKTVQNANCNVGPILCGAERKADVLLNPLNAELNPIRHLLALLGAHYIFQVSGLRVNLPAMEAHGVMQVQLHTRETNVGPPAQATGKDLTGDGVGGMPVIRQTVLRGIKLRFLGRAARRLVTTPTELSLFTFLTGTRNIWQALTSSNTKRHNPPELVKTDRQTAAFRELHKMLCTKWAEGVDMAVIALGSCNLDVRRGRKR